MTTAGRLRLASGATAAILALAAFAFAPALPGSVRALMGIAAFILTAIACSANVTAIRWRTVAWGVALQLALALFILKFSIGGVRPGYALFATVAAGAGAFMNFTAAGSEFVFGVLANPAAMEEVFPTGLVLAFAALPIIIFASSVFTVLYYLGILQLAVSLMARAMMPLMGTSGAESLSAAANVFLGQTEAPIVVRPYIPGMTQSELLALMTGGLATIAGSVFAIYVSLGADPVAMLTGSVMAAPCGLYLAKILLPETGEPATAGRAVISRERQHANLVDAAAAGAASGMQLAFNVAAMLIAFLAFIAMLDTMLGFVRPGLSMAGICAFLFAPVAALLGVPTGDIPAVADLLGTKLVTNEFVAYVKMGGEYATTLSDRGRMLATFALTGFANFGSIGIVLGGVGAMAPERRPDLARLSGRALLAGFMATMINACVAALLL